MRQLRTLSKVRERLLRYSVGAKNALHAALDDYFPELHEIFWSMNSRSLWAILERCPFPEDVVSMKRSVLTEMIAHSSRKKAGAAQKAKALHESAKKSIGVKQYWQCRSLSGKDMSGRSETDSTDAQGY